MSTPANKLLEAAKGSALPAAEGDRPADSEEVQADRTDFPCSVAQERFWLLDRLDPGNASYNVAVRWRLEGRVSTDLLSHAWATIIERHEILRTTFHEVDGAPIQRVSPTAQFRLNEVDLSALTPEERQAEGDRIGVLEARAPFDLATGPLLRATLLRFSPSTSIILVTSHQIASDGWSIGVMAREMGVIYQALRREQPIPLEPLAIQYADYSLWHLEWLRVRGTDAETAYWTKQLAGVKPFKVIPDRLRPTVPTTNGAIVSRVFPRELTNRAQVVTADRGATLFAAALAALCAALARFTNESEIVLGTQVSDRDQVELESMIGQFVNSLVLRNNLGGDPRFGELILRIRDTVALALEYRHIPIERLLGMIKGERNHANSPPISVNFIFQKTFIHNSSYGDFDLIDMPSLPAGAIYDLNFFMVERPDGWRFSCQFNTDQFESATAERLLAYVQSALESGVADPERRVSELNVCGPGEARLLLDKLNDTRTLYPRDLSLAKLFEVQALSSPESPAVTHGERQMNYGELNAAANRVAEYLRQQGVTSGARVGICLRPSLELPLAILAVLKAGAGYLLMDPAEPQARHHETIVASSLTAVIGQDYRLPSSEQRSLRYIEMGTALASGLRSPGAAPEIARDAEAAACLIHTSGGAGAVRLSHRNIANLIYSIAKRPGIGNRDVMVSVSSIAADRAAIEIFLPLLTGARLVIAGERDLASGRTLLTLLQRSAATVMYASAQTWRGLLDAGWVGYPTLKMLCYAPELSLGMLDQLAGMSGELWALYGHPETTIWSAVERLKPKQSSATIGDPIANTALYVLDAKRQLAPVGATGELVIGGDGVASHRGAAINDFPGAGGAPLYPTGDLARLRADGRIEYLGRSDFRFTHHGRLIDPTEIERILLRHAEVAEAAVMSPAAGFTDSSLTAFIVPRTAQKNDSAELIQALRTLLTQNLPGDLVPAAVVVRSSLPHMLDGTVDRAALRWTRTPTAAAAVSFEKPAGDIEQRLGELWKSMLTVDTVAPEDNFFELGGHSLLAARMLTRVEREFGRRIKLATLFSAPTLRQFAQVLAHDDLREFDFRQVVKLQPSGSKTPIIAVNNTGNYYLLAKYLGLDQPFISLQLFDPSINNARMPETLEEVATGYVELIRRVQPTGPYRIMGWCVAGALAFEIARQLNEAGHTVADLYLVDSWVPRYISRQPFPRRLVADYTLRWQLFYADWRKMRAGHQSFSDFVSNRVFVQKFKRSLANGRPPRWDEERSGAIDFSRENYDLWLLHYLQGLTNGYQPGMYEGRLTLFRSTLEPTGWFFDPLAGWGQFARRGVALNIVTGDHHTMFQDPGATEMAQNMKDAFIAGGKTATP